MRQPTDATNVRLQALRASFLASVPARVASLRRADPAVPGGLTELRDAAHQLSGTAPVFGLVDVGQAAAGIEALADVALARDGRLDEAEGRRLQALLERLDAAAGPAVSAAGDPA